VKAYRFISENKKIAALVSWVLVVLLYQMSIVNLSDILHVVAAVHLMKIVEHWAAVVLFVGRHSEGFLL
jgi:hypothetical protein